MERTKPKGLSLLALITGVEPIVIGFINNWQRLILLGLGNILLILVYARIAHKISQAKSSAEAKFASIYNKMQTGSGNGLGSTVSNTLYGKRPANFILPALIALIGGLIVHFLLPYDMFTKIAGGLVGAGIIYRILVPLIYGFKKAWKSSFGKLFLALILLGVGRRFLGTSAGKELFTIPKANAPTLVDAEIASGSTTLSGDTVTPTTPESTSGSAATGETQTPPTPESPDATTGDSQTGSEVSTLPTGPLSFAHVVPAIVKQYNLPTNGRDVTFTNISRANELYPYFKAGYHKKFFGSNINPNTTVSCNVYFVMLGLAQNRPVSYNATNVFSVFAREAEARGQTYGCVSGRNVTRDNLL